MTPNSTSSRITRTLIALAVAISAMAFVSWGVDRGIAASVGAGLSLLNWFALRWFASRIIAGEGAQKAIASLLVVGKIGLLIAIVFVLINVLRLDPLGLCLGLSVLFLGPVVGGLLAGSAGSPINPAAKPAHEER